ncbi:MAG: lysophospholipid acyltransferase family protein [Pseudomonadota bacterium]
MRLVRSLAFDFVFYVGTFIWSLGLLWTLVLPRETMLYFVRFYFRFIGWAERVFLGLTYRLVDGDKRPEGAYIVAAKHQSAWETLKLLILFDDPAIVLKHELLRIPIWGWYAAKARLIPIVRGAKGAAIASLIKGAKSAKAEGRPIVIFPQGTRLAPGAYRPYRSGIMALYEGLDLPVLPLALNSGVFWPRHARIKRGGEITVRYLDPIPPGLDRDDFARLLEDRLETATDELVQSVGGPATERPVAESDERFDTVGKQAADA